MWNVIDFSAFQCWSKLVHLQAEHPRGTYELDKCSDRLVPGSKYPPIFTKLMLNSGSTFLRKHVQSNKRLSLLLYG